MDHRSDEPDRCAEKPRIGRPSVAAERRRDILDAVETCMIEFGLGGTTLERIAAEAGMTRSNLTHFIGNRDEIIDAAIANSVTRFIDTMTQRVSDLAASERLPAFIDFTLANDTEVPRATGLLNAMFAVASHDEYAQAVLAPAIQQVDAWIATMVAERYPDSDPAVRAPVSVALPLLLREFDRTRSIEGTDHPDEFATHVAKAIDLLLGTLGPPAEDGP